VTACLFFFLCETPSENEGNKWRYPGIREEEAYSMENIIGKRLEKGKYCCDWNQIRKLLEKIT
jgi:hypothetical protein